jgi:hypothetical protein
LKNALVEVGSKDTQEEIKRIKEITKTEEKSVEAKILGICHGIREVGRKASSRRVTIKCLLRMI